MSDHCRHCLTTTCEQRCCWEVEDELAKATSEKYAAMEDASALRECLQGFVEDYLSLLKSEDKVLSRAEQEAYHVRMALCASRAMAALEKSTGKKWEELRK